MKHRIEELSAEAFAPFGVAITHPSGVPDASGATWQYWGKLGLLPAQAAGADYGIGYLDSQPCRPPRFDWAERHALTYELVVATGEVVIHVGPPDYPDELDRLPPPESFHLFGLHPGQAVVFNPKVWHGAAFAWDTPCHVFVALRRDTGPTNTAVVTLSDPIEGAD